MNYSTAGLLDALKERAQAKDARIAELESDLKLNAAMLARQCDMAREAELKEPRFIELLRLAVDECCTCGGGSPDNGCPACKVWHIVNEQQAQIKGEWQ